jgi:hypothetical protein
MFAYRRWFYAAQQHASGRQGPGDARGTRSVARGCLTQTCCGFWPPGIISCGNTRFRAEFGIRLTKMRWNQKSCFFLLLSFLGSWVLSDKIVVIRPKSLQSYLPNERNQAKQAHPVLKYRVPQGSQCVMGSLVHTGLGSSSLVAHVFPYPPPPPM